MDPFNTPKAEMVSAALLIEQRGWTAQLITEILGEPDMVGFTTSGRQEMYPLAAARQAERDPRFVAHLAALRQQARQERDAAQDQVLRGEFSVPKLGLGELSRAALLHHAQLNGYAGTARFAMGEVQVPMERAEVNYLRHESEYHRATSSNKLLGRTEQGRYAQLFAAVCAKICAAYPHLKVECVAQMKERGVPQALIDQATGPARARTRSRVPAATTPSAKCTLN